MLLFKGFFVSLPLNKGLVNSNNFYYCRFDEIPSNTDLASKL